MHIADSELTCLFAFLRPLAVSVSRRLSKPRFGPVCGSGDSRLRGEEPVAEGVDEDMVVRRKGTTRRRD